jgi:type VI secretion system protein ImpI
MTSLTLEVVGVHAASMGPDVRRILGEAEFKIGRDSDNDWILPQSYVSRHQAAIRCVNGMYFLEQVGSCPIVLNGAGRPLERNRIARLAVGDRILIEDVEIRVLQSEAPEARGAARAEPPVDVPLSHGAPIDPLELLGVRTPAPRPAAPRKPEFGSILDEAMPPKIVARLRKIAKSQGHFTLSSWLRAILYLQLDCIEQQEREP